MPTFEAFSGELDGPEFTPFSGELDKPAGAGRGAINPPTVAELNLARNATPAGGLDLPMGIQPSVARTGADTFVATPNNSGSIFESGQRMDAPENNAEENRRAMQRSVSPASVMFTSGRALDTADKAIAKREKATKAVNAIGFNSVEDFQGARADAEMRGKFAEENPLTASLATGLSTQTAGLMNFPQVAADFVNKTFVDPVLGLAGAGKMAKPPETPGTQAMLRMAADYLPKVGSKDFEEVVGTDEFRPWLLSNMAQNSPQAAMQLMAMVAPPLRAMILPAMGATSAGQNYLQGDDSRVAMAKGAVEIGTEMLPLGVFDKIQDTLSALPRVAQKQMLAQLGKRVLQAGGAVLATGSTEGSEEWISQITGNALDNYVQGKNVPWNKGAAGAYVVGAATGVGMGAPHIVTAARDNSPQAIAEKSLADAFNSGKFDPVSIGPQQLNPNISRPAPTVESQPTTPMAPPFRPAAPAATQTDVQFPLGQSQDEKSQAVANVARILGQQEQGGLASRAKELLDVGNPVAPVGEPAASAGGGSVDLAGSQRAGERMDSGAGRNLDSAAGTGVSNEQAGPVGGDSAADAPVALLNESGTLTIKGDPKAIIATLQASGITSILPAKNGVVVGANQAEQAMAVVQPSEEPKLSRAKSIDEGPAVVLQNRDRSSAASIAQMNEIAASPDFLRAGPATVMDSGAPVVFGGLPSTAAVGRTQQVADGKGQRVAVRYAVVETSDVLTSHGADGAPIQAYANGEPGKLRAVAGNARSAGITEGYRRGTAGQYRADLKAEAEGLGIDPAAIDAMRAPILVRVMDQKDVTADIGDRSNIAGTARMSATEQSATDARRLDLAQLEFAEDGEPTARSVVQFVRSMPTSEQGELVNPDGTPTRQAVDRLMAATFKQAYGSDELVRLYAQASDPESRTIMSALADAAGAMAALKDAGELDIRGAASEAAGLALNARRKGEKLADYLRTADMTTSDEAVVIAQFMAENIRSAKRISEGLRDWAQYAGEQAQIARDNETQGGMFGETPVASRSDIFKRITDGNQDRTQQPAGTGNAEGGAERQQDNAGAGQAGAATGSQQEAGTTTEKVTPRRPVRRTAQEAQPEALQQPTRADILAQQDRKDNADALDERARVDAERDASDKNGGLLQQQDAPEQRKDTTGDVFGGPTVADAKAAAEAKAKQEATDGGGGLFDGADDAQQAAEPESKSPTPEQIKAIGDITIELQTEDGAASMTVNAEKMLKSLDERESALEMVRRCLG